MAFNDLMLTSSKGAEFDQFILALKEVFVNGF